MSKYMVGNASYALLKQKTKWGLELQHIADGVVYMDGMCWTMKVMATRP